MPDPSTLADGDAFLIENLSDDSDDWVAVKNNDDNMNIIRLPPPASVMVAIGRNNRYERVWRVIVDYVID